MISATPLSALEMLATAELEPPIERKIEPTHRTVGFEAVSVADDYIVLGDGVGGLFVWRPGDTEPYASARLGHGVLAITRKQDSTIVAVGGGNATASGDDFIGSHGWVDLIDLADPSLEPSRISLASEPARRARSRSWGRLIHR